MWSPRARASASCCRARVSSARNSPRSTRKRLALRGMEPDENGLGPVAPCSRPLWRTPFLFLRGRAASNPASFSAGPIWRSSSHSLSCRLRTSSLVGSPAARLGGSRGAERARPQANGTRAARAAWRGPHQTIDARRSPLHVTRAGCIADSVCRGSAVRTCGRVPGSCAAGGSCEAAGSCAAAAGTGDAAAGCCAVGCGRNAPRSRDARPGIRFCVRGSPSSGHHPAGSCREGFGLDAHRPASSTHPTPTE